MSFRNVLLRAEDIAQLVECLLTKCLESSDFNPQEAWEEQCWFPGAPLWRQRQKGSLQVQGQVGQG